MEFRVRAGDDSWRHVEVICNNRFSDSDVQGMIVNARESDQQRFYQEVMASIQGRGWERTGVDRLQVWPLADTMAMIVADISRYKKDGSILEQGRYCYTLRKDGGAWKILTLTEVKPPFPGPGGQ